MSTVANIDFNTELDQLLTWLDEQIPNSATHPVMDSQALAFAPNRNDPPPSSSPENGPKMPLENSLENNLETDDFDEAMAASLLPLIDELCLQTTKVGRLGVKLMQLNVLSKCYLDKIMDIEDNYARAYKLYDGVMCSNSAGLLVEALITSGSEAVLEFIKANVHRPTVLQEIERIQTQLGDTSSSSTAAMLEISSKTKSKSCFKTATSRETSKTSGRRKPGKKVSFRENSNFPDFPPESKSTSFRTEQRPASETAVAVFAPAVPPSPSQADYAHSSDSSLGQGHGKGHRRKRKLACIEPSSKDGNGVDSSGAGPSAALAQREKRPQRAASTKARSLIACALTNKLCKSPEQVPAKAARRLTRPRVESEGEEPHTWWKLPNKYKKKKKQMGPPCTSPKCLHGNFTNCKHFTEADRQELFDDFWTLDREGRQSYVASLVKALPVWRRTVVETESRRVASLYYALALNGEKVRVCAQMFRSTLGISCRVVHDSVQKPTRSNLQLFPLTKKTKTGRDTSMPIATPTKISASRTEVGSEREIESHSNSYRSNGGTYDGEDPDHEWIPCEYDQGTMSNTASTDEGASASDCDTSNDSFLNPGAFSELINYFETMVRTPEEFFNFTPD